jgi:hypothetical protein
MKYDDLKRFYAEAAKQFWGAYPEDIILKFEYKVLYLCLLITSELLVKYERSIGRFSRNV